MQPGYLDRKLSTSCSEQKACFLCSQKLFISGLEFPVRGFLTGNPSNFRPVHLTGNSNRKLFSLAAPHIHTHETKATNRTHHPHTHTALKPQYQKAHTSEVWSCTKHNLIAQRVTFWLNQQPFSWFATIGVRYLTTQYWVLMQTRMDEWSKHAAVVWSCMERNLIAYRAALWFKQQPVLWFTTIGVPYPTIWYWVLMHTKMDEWQNYITVFWLCTKQNIIAKGCCVIRTKQSSAVCTRWCVRVCLCMPWNQRSAPLLAYFRLNIRRGNSFPHPR